MKSSAGNKRLENQTCLKQKLIKNLDLIQQGSGELTLHTLFVA